MKVKFTTKEVSQLVVSALVLGFVFGFDDGRAVFELAAWFSNYMLMSALALISLIIFVLAQKGVAARYKSAVGYKIWTMRRFGFIEGAYLHKRGEKGAKGALVSMIPLGILLPLIVTFLSEGKIWFAVTGSLIFAAKGMHRIGKEYIKVTDFEFAKIAVAGPMASILFSLVLSLALPGVELAQILARINIAIAIGNMLPLPNIAGATALFGAKYFYVFSFSVIILAAVLMWYVNTLATIAFALVLAILLVIIAFYFGEIHS